MHFRGTAVDCLRQFAALLPEEGARRRSRFYEPLAGFSGKSPATIARWLRKDNPQLPGGVPLIKARFFFELIGWEVIDLEDLRMFNERGYKLAELLALDIVDVKSATEELVYEDDHAILRICHGHGVCASDHLESLDALLEQHAATVERLRQKQTAKLHQQLSTLLDARWGTPSPAKIKPAPAPKPVPASDPQFAINGSTVRLAKREALRLLAYNILATHELARAVARDASPEDRRLLREMIELDDGMHAAFLLAIELKKVLDMLCGEQAREHALEQES